MMAYTQKYQELKSLFQQGADKTDFHGSDISCFWADFDSQNISVLAGERDQKIHTHSVLNHLPDESISENYRFRYPVFKPADTRKQSQAILLLHGLNERNWNKYLVWAHYLAVKTGRPVILFPIAFHMNRSPEAWSNPRVMSPVLLERRKRLGADPMSTFANVALSERLCEDPLRFFTSGQQSAADIVQLAGQLNRGEHPLFEKGTTIDIFAYSIGAFLSQILFLGNPSGLFTNARLFLFCGGAFFEEMDGVSRLIMDQQAFGRLRHYYINELGAEMDHSALLSASMNQTETGRSFLAMLAAGTLKSFRESVFEKLHKQVHAVALLKDRVIPAGGIVNALNRFIQVDVLDFPYDYSHENPFPILSAEKATLVDRGFENVFSKAAAFLQ